MEAGAWEEGAGQAPMHPGAWWGVSAPIRPGEQRTSFLPSSLPSFLRRHHPHAPKPGAPYGRRVPPGCPPGGRRTGALPSAARATRKLGQGGHGGMGSAAGTWHMLNTGRRIGGSQGTPSGDGPTKPSAGGGGAPHAFSTPAAWASRGEMPMAEASGMGLAVRPQARLQLWCPCAKPSSAKHGAPPAQSKAQDRSGHQES